MNFLSVLYAKAGITVDGVTTLNNTATALTPATSDNSTNIATTAFVKNQNYYPYPTGTTSQYVRGDGSLATFPSLTGFVPYTGATTNVDLGTHSLTASDLVINHASGSGVAASITKGGNGEALTVVKSSGSGNAASITGGTTLISELNLTTDLADAYIASAATWNAKQNAITLTTTGTSGAATLVGATLNIPQYQAALTNPITGTGTTNYLPKFTGTSALGDSLLQETTNAIGLNVTPSAWGSLSKSIQIGNKSSLFSFNNATTDLGLNVFWNSSNTDYNYIENGFVSLYRQSSGQHIWLNAPSGTAGNAISFTQAMTLTASGQLGIGTSSPARLLNISGAGTDGTQLQINGTVDSAGIKLIPVTGDAWEIQANVSNQFFVYNRTDNAYRFMIADTGNVLIGTTTDADYKLDVNGTARIQGQLAVNHSLSGNYGAIIYNTSATGEGLVVRGGSTASHTSFVVQPYDGSVALFSVVASGAATFSSSVTAQGNVSSYGQLRLETSAYGSIVVGSRSSQTDFQIYNTGNIFRIYDGSRDAFTIASSGIATFNNGTANQNTTISGSKVGMSRTSDGAEVVYFSKNTDLGTNGTANINGYDGIQFRTQGAETVKLTIAATGEATFSSSVTTGADATINGVTVGKGAGSGAYNTVLGNGALPSNTTGINNIAIGGFAKNANTTGTNNTAIGYASSYSNVTGSNNTALGSGALFANTASNNVAVGFEAALTNTSGVEITAIGYRALKANTGASNTAIGFNSLSLNTTGIQNTAIGVVSLGANTVASNNTALGYASLTATTASNNTALGFQAGNANTSGANNIFIGYQSTGVSITESNRTWIGNSSTTSTWLAGNVLINTTTDAGYKLDVNGTARVSGQLNVQNGNDGIIKLGSSTYYGTIEHDATTTGSNIYTTAAASGGGHIFKIGSSSVLTLASSGAATFSSSVTATNFIGAGTGLTGTASALSIGGSAGSAATAGYTTNTSGGAIRSYDLRIIAPDSMTAARMGFGFTSFNNNNTAPWADYLHLRSYSDGSGGADNLVVFNKSTIGMRIYQQTWNSATPYSTYKDIAFTDGTNASGTWGISITGNANYATTAGALTSMNISQFTNDSGYITSGALSAYLPLAGGTMTGNIIYSPGDATNWYIRGAANGAVVRLKYSGGTTNRSGALAWVDNANNYSDVLTWTDGNLNATVPITSNSTISTSSNIISTGGYVQGGGIVLENNYIQATAASGGFWNTNHDVRFYPSAGNIWNITGSTIGLTSFALRFLDKYGVSGTIKAQIFWSASNVGFFNDQNDWVIKANQGASFGGTLYGAWIATGSITASANSVISGAVNSAWGLQVINTGTTNANGLYVNIGASSTGVPFRVDKGGAALFDITNAGNATIKGNLTISGATISLNSSAADIFQKYNNGSKIVGWNLATDNQFRLFDYTNELIIFGFNATSQNLDIYSNTVTINRFTSSTATLIFNASTAGNIWKIEKSDANGLSIQKGGVQQFGINAAGQASFIGSLAVVGDYLSVGAYGLYSSTYTAFFRRNDVSSYGAWELVGAKGSYTGMFYNAPNRPHMMFNTTDGSGGLYYETLSRWILYYNYTNNCLAVGGTTTNATYKMYVTGAIYATGAIVANSDGRNKENVEVVENALEKVTNLRGVTYTKKDQDSGKREMGVIAQEVEPHVPEVVHHSKDADVYGVSYGNFAGLFIEAIKEQQVLINELKAEIEILKNK